MNERLTTREHNQSNSVSMGKRGSRSQVYESGSFQAEWRRGASRGRRRHDILRRCNDESIRGAWDEFASVSFSCQAVEVSTE